jgi:maleylpyruvate isomerase
MIHLLGYWRSSSSWRVRIALAHKQIPHRTTAVQLGDGEQKGPAHRTLNPLGQVPVLVLEDGQILSQSMAILEYLEETVPDPPLLPTAPVQRARVRQLAEVINSAIQPLQNLSILKQIAALGADPRAWARQVIVEGLDNLESLVRNDPGPFLLGSQPSLADVLLVPQLYNARRFDCVLDAWPRLQAAEAAAMALPAFHLTHPDHQPDAPRARCAS